MIPVVGTRFTISAARLRDAVADVTALLDEFMAGMPYTITRIDALPDVLNMSTIALPRTAISRWNVSVDWYAEIAAPAPDNTVATPSPGSDITTTLEADAGRVQQ